jgi:coniferyl-aldehyde dehydrogenase
MHGTNPIETPDPDIESRRIGAILDQQRTAFLAEGPPPLEERLERLAVLESLIQRCHGRMAEALSADYGSRSRHETMLAEAMGSLMVIRHTIKHLRDWMKPVREPLNRLQHPSGKAYVRYQPVGVVGVMAPWNYPFKLCLVPLAQALAAGNRVMVKPSELVPRSAALMAELLGDVFPEKMVAVVTGGADAAAAFSAQPFDHLMFTGSAATGRKVLRAAAENLVPVTLELGGKSPAIVGPSYDIGKAADSLAFGKLINAGQTCIAPDYCFVPEGRVDDFTRAFSRRAAAMYPTLADNPDYTAIVNDGHYARLRHMVDDARAKGARVVEINKAGEALDNRRKLPPTLILEPTEDMAVMQEEIFGPVLPVMTYTSLDEVIDYVNRRERPLALYPFTRDDDEKERLLDRTLSGGVTVNDTLLHVAIESLPFGGVGGSGMGAYHGEAGFRTFSHARAVMEQGRLSFNGAARPPFGRLIEWIGKRMIGKPPR